MESKRKDSKLIGRFVQWETINELQIVSIMKIKIKSKYVFN